MGSPRFHLLGMHQVRTSFKNKNVEFYSHYSKNAITFLYQTEFDQNVERLALHFQIYYN